MRCAAGEPGRYSGIDASRIAWLLGLVAMVGRPSVVEAYRLYQGMTMAPRGGSGGSRAVDVTGHDALLAIKLGLVILFAVISLRRGLRIEDKAFALAVVLQMLMYTGRPLLGQRAIS